MDFPWHRSLNAPGNLKEGQEGRLGGGVGGPLPPNVRILFHLAVISYNISPHF